MNWIFSRFPDETLKIESIHLLFINLQGTLGICHLCLYFQIVPQGPLISRVISEKALSLA